jgi:tight adherence protein B
MISIVVPLLIAAVVILLIAVMYNTFIEYRKTFTETTKISLEDMFLFVDPQKIFISNLLLFFIVPIVFYFLFDSIFFSLVAGIVALVLPRLLYGYLKKRRSLKLVDQLPDALNMLAGSMRSGASFQIAMDLVAKEAPKPFSQELSLVLREQKLGVSLEDAFESFNKRMGIEDVNLMVSAIVIAKDVGGNLAETLERLASTLRQKAAMEGKIRALTSQGKLSGIVVSLLPVFLAVVLNSMDPEAMRPLFETYYGWAVMAVVAVMIILGGVFIKKIVTIDV